MNKKAQTNMMVIIMITVILAMVAISVTWGLIRGQLDTTAISSDPFTATNETCTRVTTNCIVAGSTTEILNNSDAVDVTNNFVECGAGINVYGYDMAPEANTSLVGEQVNATYTEEACTRITGLTATIINYVPLLMAVIILVFVSMFAIK